ncbi:hypothetical protein Hanom_Chr13g01199601 [Helianthus anomalus]
MKFLDWYLKIGVVSSAIGGSMEYFMIKTGFFFIICQLNFTKSSSVERISKKSSGGLDADSVQFENLTARKVESDISISVEELLRYGDPNKKSKRVFDKTQELTYEQKLEIRRNLFREFAYLKKRVCDDDDSYTLELEREGPNKKRNKYECLNCNKVFTSF